MQHRSADTGDGKPATRRRLPILQGIVPVDRTRVPMDIAAG